MRRIVKGFVTGALVGLLCVLTYTLYAFIHNFVSKFGEFYGVNGDVIVAVCVIVLFGIFGAIILSPNNGS